MKSFEFRVSGFGWLPRFVVADRSTEPETLHSTPETGNSLPWSTDNQPFRPYIQFKVIGEANWLDLSCSIMSLC